ncbi:MAG: hypothetical protein HKN72_07410 [Gemmatimonadetes bacterium]|nr:hypothetical protein [Gemmatimonadota bacterium]
MAPWRSSGRPWRLLLRLVCVVGMTGCGGVRDGVPDVVVRDSAGVVVQEFTADLLDGVPSLQLPVEPEVRIGVVQGAPEYQWTRPVAGTRLSDGNFAVVEQNPAEVRIFDPSGRFVTRMGKDGDGPGEFRSPTEIAALPGDTLLIWDRRAQRLTWFSPSGVLERELTVREPGGILSPRHVALSSRGVVALGSTSSVEDLANQGKIRDAWQIVSVGPEGEAGLVLGSVPGAERDIAVQGSGAEIVSVNVRGRWWWGEGFAWASTRGVWTADRLTLEARHFDAETGLDRIIRISAEHRPFTPALIDSLHQLELDRAADPEMRALWEADFEGREYPESVPPVASVFADAVGRAWIGLTDPPPERLPSGEHVGVRRWAVFQEQEGVTEAGTAMEFVGVLRLPPRSHPLFADGEGLLLVRNDEQFDVAYVEWFPFVDR